uniref:Uncharacterized protein n=1 Tax=Oryza brachyantha TaxID=4533 RepID=J3ND16_ORYBR
MYNYSLNTICSIACLQAKAQTKWAFYSPSTENMHFLMAGMRWLSLEFDDWYLSVCAVEYQGCDRFWCYGTWWCMWLLELGASYWLLAGWHFWWLEFFCVGCSNPGFL